MECLLKLRLIWWKRKLLFYWYKFNENKCILYFKRLFKEEYFPKIEIKNTSTISDVNFRESRDKNGKLSFLSGKDKIEKIKECEVIDLSSPIKKITKIKDLL